MPTDKGADHPAAAAASTRRRLPLGIQSLGEIRERGCYYVDQTAFIARMVEEGKHYFLSRPRRFGKSLLVDTLIERGVETFTLEDTLATEALLSSFEVGDIGALPLLFQTDYLTVRGAETRAGRTMYRLGYPNREVRQSLAESLLARLSAEFSGRGTHSFKLYDALMDADLGGVRAALDALFAGIPHQWHTRNPMGRYEGWYASVFYACFASLGLDVRPEDSSAAARLDMAVQAPGHVYLFEFKLAERATEGAALAQLREKGYAEKYRASGCRIHLVGVEFSSETRGISGFEAAVA